MLATSNASQAQVPPAASATVGFENKTNTPVYVQGYTILNGIRGPLQTIAVNKNSRAYERNVPTGSFRYYTIFDANQTSRVLLRDFPVPVAPQVRSLYFRITISPMDPKKIILEPASPPG